MFYLTKIIGKYGQNSFSAVEQSILGQAPSDQTFQYVSVTHGGPGAVLRDGDNEIDAVGGLTAQGTGVSIPEPATLALLALGMFGFTFSRRNHK